MSGDVKRFTGIAAQAEFERNYVAGGPEIKFVLASDHDRIVKELREENERVRRLAAEDSMAEQQKRLQAEAALLAYQQEAVRVCDESKLYDTADAIRNLPITPRAEAIARVVNYFKSIKGMMVEGGYIIVTPGKDQRAAEFIEAVHNLNESERQHKGAE